MRRTLRFLGLSVLFALPAALQAQAPAKRPLGHGDFDGWKSIASQTLSRDGRFLAYSFMPQDADGELVVREVKTAKEHRAGVGTLPPPPLPTGEETNPEDAPQPRRVRISFTSDGRFVVATTYPTKAETEQARKERKRPDEMPKGGLVWIDLQTGAATRVSSVKSMQVPAKGGAWLAYLKEASAPAERREGGAGRGGANRGERKEYGTELVLRDLAKGSEQSFANVLDYSLARDGKTLLYTVSSRKEEENGVFAVTPASGQPHAALLQGKGKYARLAWDREQTQAAFVSDRDDAAARAPRFKVYRWARGTPAAEAVVSWDTPGLGAGLVPSDKAGLSFSRDGKRLYVAAAPPARPADGDDATSEDKVTADLWHWHDDLIQPMQKVRAGQERNRTWRGVLDIAEKRYVQVASASLRGAAFTDDGRRALGFDDSPYRRMIDYDTTYSDVYLIDASTGAKKLVLKQLRGGLGGGGGRGGPGGPGGGGGGGPVQWSPDGRWASFYQDKHWRVLDAGDGSERNLTASLPVSFAEEDDDHPDAPPSYGGAGWTRDSRSFLAHDRYDVWQLFVDGRAAKNLTEGEGRKTQTELRVQRLEPQEEDDDERGLDTARPLYLRGVSETTRASGFLKDSFEGSAPPQRLLWGDKGYRIAGRAQDADVLLVTASRFDEYPELQATDSSMKTLTRLTNGGAQMAPFSWGRSELVAFKNVDGVPLQAALYKPDGFDPKKKYPLMVYIYEKLSQNLHNFSEPRPGHNVNTSLYVSNGYLVLTPDIVYTIGQPGQSALKCVLPAIQAVVDKGFVDEDAIGIQGHSWGGYQIAYMVTQTNRFKAAEAGAPVGNMTSAYSGIRWGSGLPRQFQYERSQSRIGKTLYEAPLKFIENSPVFHAPRVQTPLLILHDDQDDAVPWYQGIELFLALRRNGKEAYLFNYNGEFHGLRRRHNQKDYALRMQQFFDHFLKGAPKPEWMAKGIPYVERDDEKERFRKVMDGTSSQR
jgi:dipeptidyl aminopeptidase/acylaminoacyl peptidase